MRAGERDMSASKIRQLAGERAPTTHGSGEALASCHGLRCGAKAGVRGSLPEATVRSAGDGAMRGVGSLLLARPAEVARRSLDAAKGLALPALGTVGDGAGRGILDASLFK